MTSLAWGFKSPMGKTPLSSPCKCSPWEFEGVKTGSFRHTGTASMCCRAPQLLAIHRSEGMPRPPTPYNHDCRHLLTPDHQSLCISWKLSDFAPLESKGYTSSLDTTEQANEAFKKYIYFRHPSSKSIPASLSGSSAAQILGTSFLEPSPQISAVWLAGFTSVSVLTAF